MHLIATFANGEPAASLEVPDDGREIFIGRHPAKQAPADGAALFLAIGEADPAVSVLHSRAVRRGDSLQLFRLPTGRNPFVDATKPGRPPLPDELVIGPGGSFGIAESGKLQFHWVAHPAEIGGGDAVTIAMPTVWGTAFDDQLAAVELRGMLNALLNNLPEVLSGWQESGELFTAAATFLRRHLGAGHRLQVDFLAAQRGADGTVSWNRLNAVDSNAAAAYRPSQTLLRDVISSPGMAEGEARLVCPGRSSQAAGPELSLSYHFEWIVALPIGLRGAAGFEACTLQGAPVVLYVESGNRWTRSPETCLPFFRLVGSLLSSLLAAREKQRVADQMGRFFSRRVRSLFSGQPAALEPVNRECTVLFCDRRAFSQATEAAETTADEAEADASRLRQLADNQQVLGRVVRIVEETGGSISDFLGDGVLAFWGWPDEADGSHFRHAQRAVEAALGIARELQDQVVRPPRGRPVFPLRIGINTGRVAVGQVGPEGHAKLSVFGSAVNVGSRLEGLAKAFLTPIILSHETVTALRRTAADSLPLLRRLCRIIPAGMSQPRSIYELVLPGGIGGSGITPEHAAQYERGLEHFESREWEACLEELDGLRADAPAIQVRRLAEDYLHSVKSVPDNWNGEIRAERK